MRVQGARSFFLAWWRILRAEALLLSVSVILAVVSSSYVGPINPLLSFRGITGFFLEAFTSDDAIAWSQYIPTLIFLMLLTICVRVSISAIRRLVSWVLRVQPVDPPTDVVESLAPITTRSTAFGLRMRAARIRGTSRLLLGTIISLLALSFIMFQSAEQNAISLYYTFSIPLQSEISTLSHEIDALARSNQSGNTEILSQKRSELQKAQQRLAEMAPPQGLSMYLLFVLSTKAAAVIFVIFLVQLLAGLYRYLTRSAFFLDSRADVLELIGAAPTDQMLVDLLSPEKAVDMDQVPAFPVVDQLRDVLQSLRAKA